MSLRNANFYLPYFILLGTVTSTFQTILTLSKFCRKHFINTESVCVRCPRKSWISATLSCIPHGPAQCVTAGWEMGAEDGVIKRHTWWPQILGKEPDLVPWPWWHTRREHSNVLLPTHSSAQNYSLLLPTAKLPQGQDVFPQTTEVKNHLVLFNLSDPSVHG